jgi:quercetin dioxygenase-like cupin family protein
VPIEVRRFGVGHRRADGPPGTTGITSQVIETGPAGVIAELAFERRGRITPHANPNWSYFIVIEGGGWVGVGNERTRILAGEAAVWPPDVLHAAWTDGTPMRAIVVEFVRSPDRLAPGEIEGVAGVLGPGGSGTPASGTPAPGRARATKGEGALRPRPDATTARDEGRAAAEREPL